MHAGHESVAIPLQTAAGVDTLRALLTVADVVLESSRPRALTQLGLSAEEIVGVSGGAWISITAYGRSTAWSNRVGFGDDVACAAGLTARDSSGAPVFCGDAIADPLAGLHAAVVALAAIATGRGGLFALSMRDLAAATLPASLPIAPRALRTSYGWTLATTHGPVEIGRPCARPRWGRASALGSATRAVAKEFRLPQRY
jgi:crotonobetainyl-CoA:carnitine CoA-transferase CaiB-like acyl-CoA transferase